MAMSKSLSFLKSVTFWVQNIVSRLASNLLHFALKSCLIHLASKDITFRVIVTFSVNFTVILIGTFSGVTHAFLEVMERKEMRTTGQ